MMAIINDWWRLRPEKFCCVVLCRILKRSRNNIFGSFDTNTFRSNYANVGRKKDQNISINFTLIMMMTMRACNNLLGQAVRMSVTRLMEWLCRACLLRNWRSRDLTWAPDHFTASLRLLRRCLHQLASSSQRIHLLLRLLIPHLLASSSRCIWLTCHCSRHIYCISQPRCTYMWPGSIWCPSYWNAAQEHQDSICAVLTFLADILPIKVIPMLSIWDFLWPTPIWLLCTVALHWGRHDR